MRGRQQALSALLLLCAHMSSTAFVVKPSSVSSSTQLYGVRSALRRRFRKPDSSPNTPTAGNDDIEAESKANEPIASAMHQPSSSSVLHETEELPEEESVAQESAIAVVQDSKEEIPVMRTLPPRDEAKLTAIEKEFRNMMDEVNLYTETDVRSLEDPRWRSLVEGACAGAVEPAVYRAFEVLFVDLVPLRIAGRLIFGKVGQVMENSRMAHQQQVEKVATTTGMSIPDIESGRFAFLEVADYRDDGDTVLNLDQLVETGVATTVVELLGYEDFDDFLQNLNADKKGELKFEECMVVMQQCPSESSSLECNPSTVLQEIAKRMAPTEPTASCERKKKFAKRYDEMVASFIEWERYVPQGEGRRLDVLRGCFVGARNQKVVEALKIVYMDYSALRMAGDTIYSLMSKLIRKPS